MNINRKSKSDHIPSPKEKRPTIVSEKKFSKETHFKFVDKIQALEFIKKHKGLNLKLFGEDKYKNSGAKWYYASTWDNIYCLSDTPEEKYYYEYFEEGDHLKLALDIDCYVDKNPQMDDDAFDALIDAPSDY